MRPTPGVVSVLVRTRTLVCALPAASVVETMRPLPTEPFAGQPQFVRGVSIIRGHPTPVVDVGRLVGGGETASVTRFVTVRTGDRIAALAVDAVLGLAPLDATRATELPSLLRHAGEDVVAALGTLDSSLLAVLDATRVVPDSVWRSLDKAAS